mmetsp:Transcript_30072/g.34960  ORF Transcript_30072/g.34960 Transcript_30072/m.34960 type:complete len:87 (+) Transcript_30072:671-931(+)
MECCFDGGDCPIIGVGDIKVIITKHQVMYENGLEKFYAQECDADPVCQGFSSDGELKYSRKNQSEWTWVNYDKYHGLFVKKSHVSL